MQPKLRFQGFHDEWQVYKLNDIAEDRIQKNQERKYSTVLTNSATLGVVHQLNFFENNTKISNQNNIDHYYIVHNNDFVYNPRISKLAPYGPIRRNKLLLTGVVSPLYLVFSIKNIIDINFIEYFFLSDKWYKYIYANGNSGARADRVSISKNTMFNMKINIPLNKEEQSQIANLLKTVDKLIELHQQKQKHLQALKQYFLQKLFC